jgi:alanine-glyoxylate transaminase/serine-glyoxylate transaminase/serine-pyruvate transaminase
MLVMTPGPIAVDHRVIAAMNRPAITHQSRAFGEVLDHVLAMLKDLFRTTSWVTVLPGSGRLGLEAALVSVVEQGDRTVHLVNGTFASWAVEIARRAGAEPTVVEGPWGGPVDLRAVAQAVERVRPKVVAMVHSETSTGARYDLQEVAEICRRHDALFLVDVISSVGCMPFAMDAWGVDLAVCTSNKGLGSLIGLSLVAVSPRAYEAMDRRRTVCQSYALDLKRWKDQFFGKPFPRAYPVVPSTHLVYALQEACRQVLEEGLEARWARHARYAEATRRAVEAAGLELFPRRDLAGNCVTAVRVPEGLDEGEIVRGMEDQGVLISGSMAGPTKGKLFRLSHQGVQASEEMLIPTLAALERTLRGLGYRVAPGTMVAAFEEALAEA